MVAESREQSKPIFEAGEDWHFSDGAYFFGAGLMLAVFATGVAVAIDAFAIAATQKILTRNVCLDGFGDTVIVVLLGVAMVTSVLTGMWIYRFRHAITRYADPGNARRTRLIRRRFAWGAVGLYSLLAPLTWLMMLGMAYCNAGSGA